MVRNMKANKPRIPTRKKPSGTRQDPEMPSDLHRQIAKRAYEIYQQRIGQGALDDWLQAEREIRQDRLHHGGDAGAKQE